MTARAPTDVLGAPYTAETIALRDDAEGEVVATLVRRKAPGRSGKAVLHLHGFADYFFQTGYADWWVARGYDFYALDLRKYGRSLRPHQTPNFVTDLHEYDEELDEAWERVTTRDRHRHVVLSGHSTGGLTGPLWADERRVDLAGVVLNAPWFDLAGSLFMRTAGTQLIKRIGGYQPKREIPRTVTGLYARSLHRDLDGEWSFDLDWKPIASWPVYAGWLGAVRTGHARLHAGLELTAPALVLTSAASAVPTEMGEDVHTTDIVLDVEQIRRWSPSLGRHVTYVAVPDARHDVFLSREPARARAYDELGRWVTTYVG
jgi:alpha-beta hydrolase superfamily lysophospholipase